MRVAQVVSSIKEEAAGPTYCVNRLCEELAKLEVNVVMHVLGRPGDVCLPRDFEIQAHENWTFPRGLGISPGMLRKLRKEALEVDIIHNHLLWMMPNYYAGRVARNSKALLVTSPHGALAPWAWQRSRWKKAAFWHLGQKDVLLNAACLHATSEGEFHDIRRMGFTAPVALIPYGVDVPEQIIRSIKPDRKKRLLFLGRIHPVKGIDLLLRVWSSVQGRYPDWELAIYGPDNDGYLQMMRGLARELDIERVAFCGPVYGDSKSRAFASADIYVLPTHTENFGMTVAEALSHGIPCIVTQGAPWSGMEDNKCGWWVERSEATLRECLADAMSRPINELRGMGERGRQWMKDEFSWQEVGNKMYFTYQWLLGGGDAPPWVRRV